MSDSDDPGDDGSSSESPTTRMNRARTQALQDRLKRLHGPFTARPPVPPPDRGSDSEMPRISCLQLSKPPPPRISALQLTQPPPPSTLQPSKPPPPIADPLDDVRPQHRPQSHPPKKTRRLDVDEQVAAAIDSGGGGKGDEEDDFEPVEMPVRKFQRTYMDIPEDYEPFDRKDCILCHMKDYEMRRDETGEPYAYGYAPIAEEHIEALYSQLDDPLSVNFEEQCRSSARFFNLIIKDANEASVGEHRPLEPVTEAMLHAHFTEHYRSRKAQLRHRFQEIGEMMSTLSKEVYVQSAQNPRKRKFCDARLKQYVMLSKELREYYRLVEDSGK